MLYSVDTCSVPPEMVCPLLCLKHTNTYLFAFKKKWIWKEEGILVFLVKMTEEPLVDVISIPTYTDTNRSIKLQRI